MEKFFELLRNWILEDPNNRSEALQQQLTTEMRRNNILDLPVVFPRVNMQNLSNSILKHAPPMRGYKNNITVYPTKRLFNFGLKDIGSKLKFSVIFKEDIRYHFKHRLVFDCLKHRTFFTIYENIYDPKVYAQVNSQIAASYVRPQLSDLCLFGRLNKEMFYSEDPNFELFISDYTSWVARQKTSLSQDGIYIGLDKKEVEELFLIGDLIGLSHNRAY